MDLSHLSRNEKLKFLNDLKAGTIDLNAKINSTAQADYSKFTDDELQRIIDLALKYDFNISEFSFFMNTDDQSFWNNLKACLVNRPSGFGLQELVID